MRRREDPETDEIKRLREKLTGKRYGLARVCRVWEISRSTLYFQRCSPEPGSGRRGPTGVLSDDEIVQQIRSLLNGSSFHGEGYRKVWARLRFKGIRTSKRRVLRLMQQNDLLAPPSYPSSHRAEGSRWGDHN